jgi:hypothetical protein
MDATHFINSTNLFFQFYCHFSLSLHIFLKRNGETNGKDICIILVERIPKRRNFGTFFAFTMPIYFRCRSQWPRGLRNGCAAFRLLGFRGRIPPGTWMSLVWVVRYQVEVYASGWSLVQRSPTECGVSEWDREASIMTKPWPIRDSSATKKKAKFFTWEKNTLWFRCSSCRNLYSVIKSMKGDATIVTRHVS